MRFVIKEESQNEVAACSGTGTGLLLGVLSTHRSPLGLN